MQNDHPRSIFAPGSKAFGRATQDPSDEKREYGGLGKHDVLRITASGRERELINLMLGIDWANAPKRWRGLAPRPGNGIAERAAGA